MMDGAHPNELDLLAYVEEDLPDPRKAAVAEHVAGCQACADSVRQLETARQILRSAPLLEMPTRKRAVLAGLPARAPNRRLRWRPGVVAPALAAAAVLAVVTGVFLVDSNGREDEAAELAAQPAEEATSEAEAGAEAGGAEDDKRALSAGAVRSVQGPPRDVALFLRSQGFDARVVDSTVRVRNADPEAVMRVLANRPNGPVLVEIVQ